MSYTVTDNLLQLYADDEEDATDDDAHVKRVFFSLCNFHIFSRNFHLFIFFLAIFI